MPKTDLIPFERLSDLEKKAVEWRLLDDLDSVEGTCPGAHSSPTDRNAIIRKWEDQGVTRKYVEESVALYTAHLAEGRVALRPMVR